MLNARLTVTNELGLHARAAANLIRGISTFKSSITLTRADTSKSADAKSILSVLTLAATKGTILDIVVDGPDETDAFVAIQSAFESGFGESNTQ
jgi:phosphocarrier protein HPr